MKDSNNSDKVSCSSLGDGGKNLFDKKRNKRIVQSVYGVPFMLDIIRQIIQAAFNIPKHYQQLPIKVKLSRLQVQPLIEKATRFMRFMYAVNTFQYKRLALLQH